VTQHSSGGVLTNVVSHNVYVNCNNSDQTSCWGDPTTFVSNFGASQFIHVLDQYVGSHTSNRYTVGSSYIDNPYLSSNHPLTSLDILDIVATAVSNLRVNGNGHVFNIFLPYGTDVCLYQSSNCYQPDKWQQQGHMNAGDWCAYHFFVPGLGPPSDTLFTVIPYQNVPFCGDYGMSGDSDTNSTGEALGHELAETITDFDLTGWYNTNGQITGEIGDLCEAQRNTINLNGTNYLLQPLYSNAISNCDTYPGDQVSLAGGTTTAPSAQSPTSWGLGSFINGSLGTYFADVTGDGRADAIAVNTDGTVYVSPSGSNGVSGYNLWTNSLRGYGSPPQYGTYFADVEGIGRADAIAVNDSTEGNAIYVAHNTGSSFAGASQWISNFSGPLGTFFADMNGDKKADAITVSTSGQVQVALSNGQQFLAPTTWSNSLRGYGTPPQYGTYFADVEGIGRADAIAVNDSTEGNAIYVAHNTGSSLSGASQWLSNFHGSVATFFADVNGDGKADAIAVNSDAIYVALSNGHGFGSTIKWTSGSFLGTGGELFADLNADMKADVIAINQ
jgi:hypothetical protein